MAHPQIAVFARLADGDANPVRKIEGQKTLLGRTMHAIAYDEIHDEFIVPQQFAQAILTFAGDASGEAPPKRVIQGSKSRLMDPDRLGLDPVHHEIYIPQGDYLLIFDRRAEGNVAPLRVIEGPDTGLGANAAGADPSRNLIIVAGSGFLSPGERGTIFRIFDRMADGNVKPKMEIRGPDAMGGPFAVYPEKQLILATNRPTGGTLAGPESYLGVWSYANGGSDVPLYRIGGPNGIFEMPRGVIYDVKNKTIIASDKRLNAVLTFSFPELFD